MPAFWKSHLLVIQAFQKALNTWLFLQVLSLDIRGGLYRFGCVMDTVWIWCLSYCIITVFFLFVAGGFYGVILWMLFTIQVGYVKWVAHISFPIIVVKIITENTKEHFREYFIPPDFAVCCDWVTNDINPH